MHQSQFNPLLDSFGPAQAQLFAANEPRMGLFVFYENPCAGIRRLMAGPMHTSTVYGCTARVPVLLSSSDGKMRFTHCSLATLIDTNLSFLRALSFHNPLDVETIEFDTSRRFLTEETYEHALRSSSWKLPGIGTPEAWSVSVRFWFAALRSAGHFDGCDEASAESLYSEWLNEFFNTGVEWVVSSLPTSFAEALRKRPNLSVHVAYRLLSFAQVHLGPNAYKYAVQALHNLPLGLLHSMVQEADHNPNASTLRDALFSGQSVSNICLSLWGAKPATFRLLARRSADTEQRFLSDLLVDQSLFNLAAQALRLIKPHRWPKNSLEQARLVTLLQTIQAEKNLKLDPALVVSWLWLPSNEQCGEQAANIFELVRQFSVAIVHSLDLPWISFDKILGALHDLFGNKWLDANLIARSPSAAIDLIFIEEVVAHLTGKSIGEVVQPLFDLTKQFPDRIELLLPDNCLPKMHALMPIRNLSIATELGGKLSNCLAEPRTVVRYLLGAFNLFAFVGESGEYLGVLATHRDRAGFPGYTNEDVFEVQIGEEKADLSERNATSEGLHCILDQMRSKYVHSTSLLTLASSR